MIFKYEELIEKYKNDLENIKQQLEKQQQPKQVINRNSISSNISDRNSNKLIDTFDDEKEEIMDSNECD